MNLDQQHSHDRGEPAHRILAKAKARATEEGGIVIIHSFTGEVRHHPAHAPIPPNWWKVIISAYQHRQTTQ